MTINPAKFEAQGKPTPDQASTVYDSLTHQTVDALHKALTGRGYSISRATCARWIKNRFIVMTKPGRVSDVDKGDVPGVSVIIRAAEQREAAIIGSEMTPAEASAIQKDMDELAELEIPALKALQEKERIRYNIMMLRQAQRKSDKLVLIPKDSAAFIVAMTDAAESAPTVPAGQLPGDNAKVIEATANPVSDAIAQFKRKTGVAA